VTEVVGCTAAVDDAALTTVVVCVSYNHSRDDEEVYKEFLEIANEIIPQILRMDHDGVLARDPAAYALLLQFYDGLCCWEEDSQTPVLHITWATHMLSSFSKFDAEARTSVELLDTGAEDDKLAENRSPADKTSAAVSGGLRPHSVRKRHPERTVVGGKSEEVPSVGKSNGGSSGFGELQVAPVYCETGGSSEVSPVGIDSQLTPSSDELKMSLVEQLASQSDENDDDGDRNSEIVALAHACGESLLNPDFLRGSGEPFVKDAKHQLLSSATDTQMDLNAFAACTDVDPSSRVHTVSAGVADTSATSDQRLLTTSDVATERQPRLMLHSAKMLALKQLLIASKLNASAMKLHLTAQSQVTLKPSHVGRPLSTHFYSDDRQRRAIKRRAND